MVSRPSTIIDITERRKLVKSRTSLMTIPGIHMLAPMSVLN